MRLVIIRSARQCGLLLIALVIPAMSAAQTTRELRYGFALSVTPNMAEAFSSSQGCPHGFAAGLSMRALLGLSRVLHLEALGEAFAGPGGGCDAGPTVPPLPTGPFSLSRDFYEERVTGPPSVLSLRLGAHLPSTSRASMRPYVGVAHLPRKAITMPVAGVTLNVGRGEPRLILEAEGWLYSIRKQHAEEDYLDGRLVRRVLTVQDIKTFTTVLRVGITSPFGRQSSSR